MRCVSWAEARAVGNHLDTVTHSPGSGWVDWDDSMLLPEALEHRVKMTIEPPVAGRRTSIGALVSWSDRCSPTVHLSTVMSHRTPERCQELSR
jgi:hypothetical protein